MPNLIQGFILNSVPNHPNSLPKYNNNVMDDKHNTNNATYSWSVFIYKHILVFKLKLIRKILISLLGEDQCITDHKIVVLLYIV